MNGLREKGQCLEFPSQDPFLLAKWLITGQEMH